MATLERGAKLLASMAIVMKQLASLPPPGASGPPAMPEC
eukprot:CAMPEP_0197916756 /NCGR_PEP_ID=MMETSP1439-20131203/82563_1 /TAXON_ID=66791 /ORGANISM="Gonyaulax spinifera, Strain CCMP409" /LENGTH=38 /DNA_ID= /DNA_START= /DNA_END= /DNA_ORIENTATION=